MEEDEGTYTTGLEDGGGLLEQVFTDAGAAGLRSRTAKEENDLSTASSVHSLSKSRFLKGRLEIMTQQSESGTRQR